MQKKYGFMVHLVMDMLMIVRHEGAGRRRKPRRMQLCCTKDEGGPLETAMQVEVSNHLKLLWSKATVVSVKEKAGQDLVRYVLWRRTQVNR